MEPLENTVNVLHAAVADVTKLLNLHVELLRAEAAKAAVFTKRIAVLGFFLILGLIPTAVMLALAISHFIESSTGLTAWQSELLVGLACLTGCAVLAYGARSQIQKLQDK